MELFQIRYFHETATRGGVHKAALHLNVSAPAISKAIANLEDELNLKLFDRNGRSLVLTEKGKHFLVRAGELLDLADKTRTELMEEGWFGEVVLTGREILLEHYGLAAASLIKKQYPGALIRFLDTDGEDALHAVKQGKANVAFTLQPPPPGWKSVCLGDIKLVTVAAAKHPLARSGKPVHIKEVREHGFISPNLPLFGRVGESKSIDGWRDDIHPRNIAYVVESLSLFRELLLQGKGLGYVPDFWARKLGLHILTVEGCSFQSKNKLYVSAKRDEDFRFVSDLPKAIASTT